MPGWKAGLSVSFCHSCNNATENLKKQAASLAGVKTKTRTGQSNSHPQKSYSSFSTKRKCLDLSEKVAVIKCAQDHPCLRVRKIAEHFQIGRTQIQTIIKSKESKLALCESSVERSQQKQQRTAKFSNVNETVWNAISCVETLIYTFLDQYFKKRP